MEEAFSDRFKKYLMKEETVLWTGEPNNEFFSSDRNISLSSIGFVLFGVFWEMMLVQGSVNYMNKYGSIHFIFFVAFFSGLIAICYSVYKILNVTVIRRNAWENTSYVITDKRILVIIGRDHDYEEVIEKRIDELTSVNISDRSLNQADVGTIIFGEIPFKPEYVRSSDRENAKKNSQIKGIIVFNNIKDVCGVYVLINKLRTKS